MFKQKHTCMNACMSQVFSLQTALSAHVYSQTIVCDYCLMPKNLIEKSALIRKLCL